MASGALLSRRQVLGYSGGLTAALSLAGCDLLATEPSGSEQRSRAKGKQAPRLADLVKSGDLPDLANRLPEDPLVVQPIDRVGTYGGSWRSVLLGASDTSWLSRTIGTELLLRYDPGWTKIIPNIATSVDASSDAREFTITLRKGMRWSDGKPFTADDLVFALDEVMKNLELTPVVPSYYVSGGDTPAEVMKVDDVTAVITFARPNGLFLETLATPRLGGEYLVRYPRQSRAVPPRSQPGRRCPGGREPSRGLGGAVLGESGCLGEQGAAETASMGAHQ